MPKDGTETDGANGHPATGNALNHNHQPPPDRAVGRDAESNEPRLRRGAWRALVQDFTPLWFTWCMNSGAIAELLHQCPYRFRGIDVLSNIFFVVDLVLFVVFSVLFITRFLWFRAAAYREVVDDIPTLTFTSCWPISFMTLTSLVALTVSTASWGGHAFTLVAYVMWWFVVAWNGLCVFWVFITLIRRHDARDRRMPITIIISAVSVSTVAVTGAVVAAYSHDISARLAVPVMIVSFNWVGVGILLGLILYVYLLHALFADGWPPPAQTPTMFILVGPMGQSAAALQILGAAATTFGRFGDYDKGSFLTASSAQALEAACVLLALLMNGLGVIWTGFAVYAMVERAVQRKLTWSPTWNAIIFPMGTLTTSFIVFAIEMDSPAYRAVSAILIIVLVIFYLVNLFMTLLRIWQGRLLIVREDWRVRQRMEEQQKER